MLVFNFFTRYHHYISHVGLFLIFVPTFLDPQRPISTFGAADIVLLDPTLLPPKVGQSSVCNGCGPASSFLCLAPPLTPRLILWSLQFPDVSGFFTPISVPTPEAVVLRTPGLPHPIAILFVVFPVTGTSRATPVDREGVDLCFPTVSHVCGGVIFFGVAIGTFQRVGTAGCFCFGWCA